MIIEGSNKKAKPTEGNPFGNSNIARLEVIYSEETYLLLLFVPDRHNTGCSHTTHNSPLILLTVATQHIQLTPGTYRPILFQKQVINLL